MVEVEKTVVDKESEDYLEYQVELKQFIVDKAKFRDDIHKCFYIIMGQCSPAVEQNLEAEEVFEELKNKSNSIELIMELDLFFNSSNTSSASRFCSTAGLHCPIII